MYGRVHGGFCYIDRHTWRRLRSNGSSLLSLNLLYMETSQGMIAACVLRRRNAGAAPAAVGGAMFRDAFMRGEHRPARPLKSKTFTPGSAMA